VKSQLCIKFGAPIWGFRINTTKTTMAQCGTYIIKTYLLCAFLFYFVACLLSIKCHHGTNCLRPNCLHYQVEFVLKHFSKLESLVTLNWGIGWGEACISIMQGGGRCGRVHFSYKLFLFIKVAFEDAISRNFPLAWIIVTTSLNIRCDKGGLIFSFSRVF